MKSVNVNVNVFGKLHFLKYEGFNKWIFARFSSLTQHFSRMQMFPSKCPISFRTSDMNEIKEEKSIQRLFVWQNKFLLSKKWL